MLSHLRDVDLSPSFDRFSWRAGRRQGGRRLARAARALARAGPLSLRPQGLEAGPQGLPRRCAGLHPLQRHHAPRRGRRHRRNDHPRSHPPQRPQGHREARRVSQHHLRSQLSKSSPSTRPASSRPNGTTVAIEPKHVQLRDVATDYPGLRPRQAARHLLPQPGSRRRLRGQVDGARQEPRIRRPVLHALHLRRRHVSRGPRRAARSPAQDKAFKYATVNGNVDPKIDRARRPQALSLERVATAPELPQDENLPSKEELRLQVACSTFPPWEAVGQWKQKLRADCWKCLPPSAARRSTRRDARSTRRRWKRPAP